MVETERSRLLNRKQTDRQTETGRLIQTTIAIITVVILF